MSLLEPRLSDLRAGFGGYGFSPSLSVPSNPMVPLWRAPQLPSIPWCTVPSCPCAMSRPVLSRSYLMSDMYDYSTYTYPWSAWYLKAAQDPLYKGLPLPPPPLEGLEQRAEPREDHRSSPGKELPTKHLKQERQKERLELTKPLNFDKEHSRQHQLRQSSTDRHSPVCSVSNGEHYRNGESVSEAYSLHHHKLISSHPALRSPPPPHPPPRYPQPRELHSPHEGPLNLSITNSGVTSANEASGNHSPTQSRPSVITCATSASCNGRYEGGGSGSSSPARRDGPPDICDPAIEEHFRRSLGKNYPDYMGKQVSVTPSPPPPPVPQPLQAPPSQPLSGATTGIPKLIVNSNVSITGSVDDHFARALGDSTWSALKAKNDPAESPSPGSVDDHFAKALGDTWLRIKAERESPRGPPPPFPINHSVPHNMPHPLPQHPAPPTSQSHGTSLLST